MAKTKLKKFAENAQTDCIVQSNWEEVFDREKNVIKPHGFNGKWQEIFFKNRQSIVLELGCGKGEYTVQLAEKNPTKNYIGVDIKGARIWEGAKQARQKKLMNVGFLRTRIEWIRAFFAPQEVQEIWITFPDPQPQERREKKRLTSPVFLDAYEQIAAKNAVVHLKTDAFDLYQYTLDVVRDRSYPILFQTADLYGESINNFDEATQEILGIKTHYEGVFSAKGFKICYLKFQINVFE